MRASKHWVVVGLDNGGTSNNATVLDSRSHFLVDRLVESASFVLDGPEAALDALVSAFDSVLALTGTDRRAVRAVGLDTPGPTSADGVISSKGSTNFSAPAWRGFDVRSAGRGPVFGVGDRRDRARWWCHRCGSGGPRCIRHGRRARSRPHPNDRAARGRPAAARMQLWLHR